MPDLKCLTNPFRSFVGKTCLNLLMFCMAGCGSSSPNNNAQPQPAPQTYFAPYVAGTTYSLSTGSTLAPQTYAMDDKGGQFSQTIYLPTSYSQVVNAGNLKIVQRGLRSLPITANYIFNNTISSPRYEAVTHDPPETGSYAVELAGQTGGLVQLVGQPVAPLVAATQCPSLKTAQTYLFVTIPASLNTTGQSQSQPTSDPATDTAYGTVDISSSGSTVNFQNIHQFTLPSVGGSGAPAQPASSPQTGTCASTTYGQITNVPAQLTITNPGTSQSLPPQAEIGMGASGLLVEDNGAVQSQGHYTLPGTSPPLYYNNVLGAGTGAVGLPKPSSALGASAVVGAQYLGFIYAAGTYASSPTTPVWSSHLASFGFSSVPSSCASLTPSTGTLIYGGDFTNDDPSSSPDGFGNCDFAIDLGAQDAATNGLYPHATIWVGANYAANSTGATYSFPAVAIAGQLNGKYALFLIGTDASSQPWGIYLLQSN